MKERNENFKQTNTKLKLQELNKKLPKLFPIFMLFQTSIILNRFRQITCLEERVPAAETEEAGSIPFLVKLHITRIGINSLTS